MKDKKIVSDEEISRYLEEAGNASDVRWRGIRVRMNRLLLSLDKVAETDHETKAPKAEDDPEAARTRDNDGAEKRDSAMTTDEPSTNPQNPGGTQKVSGRKDEGDKEEPVDSRTQKRRNQDQMRKVGPPPTRDDVVFYFTESKR